jgi:hypothetical protein
MIKLDQKEEFMPFLVPLFTFSIFLSAFLLFAVQPMMGKTLLPLLGGGPSVWNTAMLFFQILLLVGYAYAHLVARLSNTRHQVYVHAVVLLAACATLPLSLPDGADPTGHVPILWQLQTMAVMIAAPFFVLSSTAPLLQNWFARAGHVQSDNPYFLYVASNIGSFAALLSYPFIIEPLLTLHGQMGAWSLGYIILAVMLLACGFAPKFIAHTKESFAQDTSKTPWKTRFIWIFLAFLPSSLMLGFTTYVTTDVTTVPLFWIIPLSLYLLTFIIAFGNKPALSLPATRIVQAVVALFLLWLMMSGGHLTKWIVVFVHTLFFFFTALLCHQELAALKPKPSKLTEFFLMVSIGGALGGVFNSLLAPLIFPLPYEYTLIILLSLTARYISSQNGAFARDSAFIKSLRFKWSEGTPSVWPMVGIIALSLCAMIPGTKGVDVIFAAGIVFLLFRYLEYRAIFASLFALVVLMNPPIPWNHLMQSLVVERNYYGVVRVNDEHDLRIMTHGVTNHGGQALDVKKRFEPYGYYSTTSGLADVFRTSYMSQKSQQNIAILGLGTGSMACFYNAQNRHFDYFEIDPAVIRIASDPTYFTYLSDCNIDYTMHTGDGRLLIKRQPDDAYNLIVMDAFTSDNIPVHLITKDAVDMYRQKLKQDGILLFHISNRFFVLQYELAAIAKSFGKTALYKLDEGINPASKMHTTMIVNYPNKYVVLTDNKGVERDLLAKGWVQLEDPGFTPWSDDYANILRATPLATWSQ